MLKGELRQASGELTLRGNVWAPGIRRNLEVDFVVDTGASTTLLPASVLEEIGVDIALLPYAAIPISGVGGVLRSYDASCLLSFEDGPSVHFYRVTASVPDPRRSRPLPPILGRDVLRRWRMVYDEPRSVLSFTVRSADRTYTRRAAPRPRA